MPVLHHLPEPAKGAEHPAGTPADVEGRLVVPPKEVVPVNEAMKSLLIELAERHKIDFDERDTLTSEDEFSDFSEYGAEGQESGYVDFKFGDYSAKISQSTYDMFVEQVNETKEETGEVMLDNVIQGWFAEHGDNN